MQQRRLRLGDIVDDYCPRERRITNHAIVAMIGDEVKQTRCTTCDADHEYKQAKVPAQRRKKDALVLNADAAAALSRKRSAVEADAPDPVHNEAADAAHADNDRAEDEPVERVEPAPVTPEPSVTAAETLGTPGLEEPPAPVEDEGPVHRRLIRATLPRPEGQPPERKLPEFTTHQRDPNGNRAGRAHRRGPRPNQRMQQSSGQSRFGGQRQGPGSRQGSGQGSQGQRSQGQRAQGQRPQGNRTGHGHGQPGQQQHHRHGGGRKRGR